MRCLIALFIFLLSYQVAIAESFGLRITIPSRNLPPDDLNARLYYALERPSINRVPISDVASLKNGQRNSHGQLEFVFDKLEFPDGVSRGFFWGEVTDTSGRLLLRIPLTVFYDENRNDRNLILMTVAAQPIGLDALRESYPIYLPDSRFLDENNVLFSLQAVRTLVDAGFVLTDFEWQRIFDKFNANIDFFQRGGAADLELILRYLHERYEILSKTDASIDAYSNFYLQFLSRLAELNIDGLEAPDGTTLAQYTLIRQRQIIGNRGVAVLGEVMNSQALYIDQRDSMRCLQFSYEMLLEMNADEALWSNIDRDSQLERNVKIFLKRFVDCAQRYFRDHGPDNATMGNLKGGFVYFFESDIFGEQALAAFFAVVLKLEERGLFLRRNRNGPYQQVYVYYDEFLEFSEKQDAE